MAFSIPVTTNPEGSELSEMTDQHKLYYHKLGTPQSEDILIYGGSPEEKHRYVGASVTEDGRYLFISASKTTSGNVAFLKDLSQENSPLRPVDESYSTDSYLLEALGEPTFHCYQQQRSQSKSSHSQCKASRRKELERFYSRNGTCSFS
jgi:protease II